MSRVIYECPWYRRSECLIVYFDTPRTECQACGRTIHAKKRRSKKAARKKGSRP